MTKTYKFLSISALIVLLLMIISYFVLQQMNLEFKIFYAVIPAVFALLIGVLAYFSRKQEKTKEKMEVGKILAIRGILLFAVIILFAIGIYLNRDSIILFTVLFLSYYLVFAVTETKVLMDLQKTNSN